MKQGEIGFYFYFFPKRKSSRFIFFFAFSWLDQELNGQNLVQFSSRFCSTKFQFRAMFKCRNSAFNHLIFTKRPLIFCFTIILIDDGGTKAVQDQVMCTISERPLCTPKLHLCSWECGAAAFLWLTQWYKLFCLYCHIVPLLCS